MAVKCGFVLGQVEKTKKNVSSKSKANNVCGKIRLRETAASVHCISSYVTRETDAHTVRIAYILIRLFLFQ